MIDGQSGGKDKYPRRTFLKNASVASLGALLAGCRPAAPGAPTQNEPGQLREIPTGVPFPDRQPNAAKKLIPMNEIAEKDLIPPMEEIFNWLDPDGSLLPAEERQEIAANIYFAENQDITTFCIDEVQNTMGCVSPDHKIVLNRQGVTVQKQLAPASNNSLVVHELGHYLTYRPKENSPQEVKWPMGVYWGDRVEVVGTDFRKYELRPDKTPGNDGKAWVFVYNNSQQVLVGILEMAYLTGRGLSQEAIDKEDYWGLMARDENNQHRLPGFALMVQQISQNPDLRSRYLKILNQGQVKEMMTLIASINGVQGGEQTMILEGMMEYSRWIEHSYNHSGEVVDMYLEDQGPPSYTDQHSKEVLAILSPFAYNFHKQRYQEKE